MRYLSSSLVVLLGLVFIAGCARPPASDRSVTLSGEVVYRERMALPPSAVVLVTLLESLPGQPAKAISTLRVETAGRSIPIPFSLRLDGCPPPKAAYALSATIEVDGTPLFRTPSPVPVQGPVPVQDPQAGATPIPEAAVPPNDVEGAKKPLVLLTRRVIDQERHSGALPRFAARLPQVLTGVAETAPARRVTLTLHEDHVFTLRHEEHVFTPRKEAATGTSGTVREQSGRWHELTDGSVQLASPEFAPLLLTPENDGGLTLREPAARRQPTSAGITLNPATPSGAKSGSPVPPQSRRMSGQYRYLADAATFQDCATQTVYAVEGGAEGALLQSLYVSKSRLPGEPLLARIDATRVEPRPADREGRLPFLQVDHVAGIAKELCPPLDNTPPALLLGGGNWDLLEAFGDPVRPTAERGKAHLVFTPSAPDRGAVSGSDGCNRFRGAYLIQDDRLHFSQMASTLMLCQELGDEPMRFHRALNEADGWRAMGKVLELTRNGKVIAVFEKTPEQATK